VSFVPVSFAATSAWWQQLNSQTDQKQDTMVSFVKAMGKYLALALVAIGAIATLVRKGMDTVFCSGVRLQSYGA
jgi:hypothetical protein